MVGCLCLVTAVAAAAWLAHRTDQVRSELTAAVSLVPQLKSQLMESDAVAARGTLDRLETHTAAARSVVADPIWKAASALPWIGPNFSAITEVSLSSADLVDRAAEPMLRVFKSLDWKSLTPVDGKINVRTLAESSSSIVSIANTVDLTHSRLAAINPDSLLPDIAGPLRGATDTLNELRGTLSLAADTSRLLPTMLGSGEPRNYLVLVQNNAEVRATGGLPGALATLRTDDGAISLTAQSSGSSMGKFDPPVDVDPAQGQIYTDRLGSYIGDVNLTPDFPTVARSAKAMWEKRHGTKIDGVIALDPVVLAHILDASGPMPAPASPGADGLPQMLTGSNVVKTLLSDVYTNIESNELQDAYFASVSQVIFKGLASGRVPGQRLIEALGRSVAEDRLLIWSSNKEEQRFLGTTTLGGAISGPNAAGTSFGVYFNDGTGAKMDYYVKRVVDLAAMCEVGGFSEAKLRVTLTNGAPSDAATSLPATVTGGGLHGTPPGRVTSNVIVYGPAQSLVEGASVDGVSAPIGSFVHDQRPVGVIRTNLGPGQSTVIEFKFSKVIQNQSPTLRVTPTLEDPKAIIKMGESNKVCNAA